MKTHSRYIQPVACGLFDGHRRLEQIQSLGNPLAALNAVMDWTIFDPVMARIPRAEPKAPGGRPAYLPLTLAHVCEKGGRGQALTQGQKRSNRAKSRQRARVEPIFGFKTGSMRAMFQRAIGFARNRAGIIMTNLVYNLARTEQIIRLKLLRPEDTATRISRHQNEVTTPANSHQRKLIELAPKKR